MRQRAIEPAVVDERPAISGIALLSAVVAEALLVLCVLTVIGLFRVNIEPEQRFLTKKGNRERLSDRVTLPGERFRIEPTFADATPR